MFDPKHSDAFPKLAISGFCWITLLIAPHSLLAQGPEIEWHSGPGTFDLGRNLAEIHVEEGFLFCDGENTRTLMEALGNRTDGSEVGTIVPESEDSDWLVIFEYADIGYVRDDEKDEIDADELLNSIRDANEDANQWREENGIPALHVTRWQFEPAYDDQTHNLQWSLLAVSEDDNSEVANHNTRILGRSGYMSVTVVADPSQTTAVVREISGMIDSFRYKEGNRYTEFVDGDRVADIGLAALVAGGAGVAAAKLGLFAVIAKFFAKAWKLIVGVLIALGAGLRRLFGGRDEEVVHVPPPPSGQSGGSGSGA